MFGRKRIRKLEAQLEGMREAYASAYKEAKAWRKLYEQKHQRLAEGVAQHKLDVKERMDEYATAILENEAAIKQLLERGERRTISDMVNEKKQEPISTAQIVDEWVNGKQEGADDE